MAKNFFDVNDRTLDPTEVHRKDKEELYETAFNEDQKAVLDDMRPEPPAPELPEVTEDDNGKVLTVVEGVWDKAEASGGGGVETVTFNIETTNGDPPVQSITADKTFSELVEVVESGKLIIPYVLMDDDPQKMYVGPILPLIEDGVIFAFSLDAMHQYVDSSELMIAQFSIGMDEQEIYTYMSKISLHSTTEQYNG